MNNQKIRSTANIVLPILGTGLMIYYDSCETTCANLSGTILGIDLKAIGIAFMATWLFLNLIVLPEAKRSISLLRTTMLAAALGGEVLLVRFQIVHNTFCPYCLAFLACLIVLCVCNAGRQDSWRVAGSGLLAGAIAFALWFEGTAGPMLFLLD